METAEQKSPSNRQKRSNSLLPYFLASMLIHGLIILAIALKERSQPTVKQQQNNNPIEFVVVPPEKNQDKPLPKTKRRAETNSVARGKIKSKRSPTTEKKGNTAIDSPSNSKVASSQSQPKKSPLSPPEKIKSPQTFKPIPPVASKPESIQPPQSPTPKNSPIARSLLKPIPSGEQTIPTKDIPLSSQPNPIKSKTQSLNPSKSTIRKTPPSSSSAKKTPTNSGVASLLGGKYQRSLKQDGGSAFFAARSTGSQEAPYARLDAQQDDMGPYFAKIKRRVKKNWQPVSVNQEEYTVLTFVIERSGQITGLKVAKTSGDEQADREALDAVKNAAPFGTLPQSFKGDRLPVEFSFNIFIDRGSLSSNLGNIFP